MQKLITALLTCFLASTSILPAQSDESKNKVHHWLQIDLGASHLAYPKAAGYTFNINSSILFLANKHQSDMMKSPLIGLGWHSDFPLSTWLNVDLGLETQLNSWHFSTEWVYSPPMGLPQESGHDEVVIRSLRAELPVRLLFHLPNHPRISLLAGIEGQLQMLSTIHDPVVEHPNNGFYPDRELGRSHSLHIQAGLNYQFTIGSKQSRIGMLISREALNSWDERYDVLAPLTNFQVYWGLGIWQR